MGVHFGRSDLKWRSGGSATFLNCGEVISLPELMVFICQKMRIELDNSGVR